MRKWTRLGTPVNSVSCKSGARPGRPVKHCRMNVVSALSDSTSIQSTSDPLLMTSTWRSIALKASDPTRYVRLTYSTSESMSGSMISGLTSLHLSEHFTVVMTFERWSCLRIFTSNLDAFTMTSSPLTSTSTSSPSSPPSSPPSPSPSSPSPSPSSQSPSSSSPSPSPSPSSSPSVFVAIDVLERLTMLRRRWMSSALFPPTRAPYVLRSPRRDCTVFVLKNTDSSL